MPATPPCSLLLSAAGSALLALLAVGRSRRLLTCGMVTLLPPPSMLARQDMKPLAAREPGRLKSTLARGPEEPLVVRVVGLVKSIPAPEDRNGLLAVRELAPVRSTLAREGVVKGLEVAGLAPGRQKSMLALEEDMKLLPGREARRLMSMLALRGPPRPKSELPRGDMKLLPGREAMRLRSMLALRYAVRFPRSKLARVERAPLALREEMRLVSMLARGDMKLLAVPEGDLQQAVWKPGKGDRAKGASRWLHMRLPLRAGPTQLVPPLGSHLEEVRPAEAAEEARLREEEAAAPRGDERPVSRLARLVVGGEERQLTMMDVTGLGGDPLVGVPGAASPAALPSASSLFSPAAGRGRVLSRRLLSVAHASLQTTPLAQTGSCAARAYHPRAQQAWQPACGTS